MTKHITRETVEKLIDEYRKAEGRLSACIQTFSSSAYEIGVDERRKDKARLDAALDQIFAERDADKKDAERFRKLLAHAEKPTWPEEWLYAGYTPKQMIDAVDRLAAAPTPGDKDE